MSDESRFRAVALATAVALLLLTGCGSDPEPQVASPATEEPQRGGVAVLGSISDVDSWNEYVTRQTLAGHLLRRIYLRLAQENGDGQQRPQSYSPLLAESWEFGDDGSSLTFQLREASWSDGTPITADDVLFTWEVQRSESIPWIGAGAKERIESVEVEDDRRVTFRFDGSYPYMLADAVEGGILPRHIFGSVPFEEWATHDWSTVRVASGPMMLDSHEAGHQIVLTRNPAYYDTSTPRLDKLVVRIVPDASSLVTQLRTGEVDLMLGVTPKDADRLERDGSAELVDYDYPGYDYLGWNGSRAPFDDPQLRRALTLAIDREALVEELLYGYGRVSHGPVFSQWWGANRELVPLPFDRDEARRLLAEQGYATVDDAGEPLNEGRTLSLELLTNSGNTLRESMLVKIQQHLALVGVDVRVQPLEMRTMRQKVGSGDYDGYLGGWVFLGKIDLKALFGSESVPPRGVNVVSYRSEEVDRLFSELDRASTWQEMKPLLDRIQQEIHEDQPYSFLYESRKIAAHTPRLAGVRIANAGDPLSGLGEYWVRR